MYKVYTIPEDLRNEVELMDDGLRVTGKGDVKVERRRDATITFSAETAEHVRIAGTIECHAFAP